MIKIRLWLVLMLVMATSTTFAMDSPDVAVKAMTEGKIVPDFNLERVSRSVLGKKWNEASAEQKLAFQEEFRKVLLKRYSESIAKYKNQPVEYNALPMQANDTVTVNAMLAGAQVKYLLQMQSDAWKVNDIVMEDISLVTNYRSQFSQEINQNGLDSLISKLKEKNSSATNTSTTLQANNNNTHPSSQTRESPQASTINNDSSVNEESVDGEFTSFKKSNKGKSKKRK